MSLAINPHPMLQRKVKTPNTPGQVGLGGNAFPIPNACINMSHLPGIQEEDSLAHLGALIHPIQCPISNTDPLAGCAENWPSHIFVRTSHSVNDDVCARGEGYSAFSMSHSLGPASKLHQNSASDLHPLRYQQVSMPSVL